MSAAHNPLRQETISIGARCWFAIIQPNLSATRSGKSVDLQMLLRVGSAVAFATAFLILAGEAGAQSHRPYRHAPPGDPTESFYPAPAVPRYYYEEEPGASRRARRQNHPGPDYFQPYVPRRPGRAVEERAPGPDATATAPASPNPFNSFFRSPPAPKTPPVETGPAEAQSPSATPGAAARPAEAPSQPAEISTDSEAVTARPTLPNPFGNLFRSRAAPEPQPPPAPPAAAARPWESQPQPAEISARAAPPADIPSPGRGLPAAPRPVEQAPLAPPDPYRVIVPREQANTLPMQPGLSPYGEAPGSVDRPPVAITPDRAQVLASLPPEDRPEEGEPQELPPQFKRQLVDYATKEPAGTVIIATQKTYLYLVLGNGKAVRYGIGVGREGFTWAGRERISRMSEWPDWYPPADMIERQPYLPRMMAGGPGNPLGARALYLGKTLYRIHGTNQPSTIGTFVSSGCIRMLNDDVIDLYGRIQVGTRVVVLPGRPPKNAADGTRAADGTVGQPLVITNEPAEEGTALPAPPSAAPAQR
jgi:lipoprotein-anchoring transpeptidase ErfK/SrfK